jgi:hypothetical protein
LIFFEKVEELSRNLELEASPIAGNCCLRRDPATRSATRWPVPLSTISCRDRRKLCHEACLHPRLEMHLHIPSSVQRHQCNGPTDDYQQLLTESASSMSTPGDRPVLHCDALRIAISLRRNMRKISAVRINQDVRQRHSRAPRYLRFFELRPLHKSCAPSV